ADLLPGHVDEAERTYTTTLTLPRSEPRTIHIFQGRSGFAGVKVEGPKLGQRKRDDLTAAVRRILNLDEDLSEFYALVANDPDLAVGVAAGTYAVEELGAEHNLSDDEVASRLLALPGIGPYGTAHMMMLLGRHSRLILDSWTRPKYAHVNGRKASDATVERRF